MVNTAKTFMIMLNNLQQMHVKLLQKESLKIAETTGDLIDNKIANKIMKTSRSLPQNNSETITSKPDKELPKERYVSPKERHKTIDNLRLI